MLLILIFTSIDDLNKAGTEQFENVFFPFVIFKLIRLLGMFVISKL